MSKKRPKLYKRNTEPGRLRSLYEKKGMSIERIHLGLKMEREEVEKRLRLAGVTEPFRHDRHHGFSDEQLKRYALSGFSPRRLGREKNITERYLADDYIRLLGRQPIKNWPVNEAEIVRLYVEEENGQPIIAKAFNISRVRVSRILASHNVQIRNFRDNTLLIWKGASQKQRQAMLSAAHQACRGRAVSRAELIKRANSKAGRIQSKQEQDAYDALVAAELFPLPGYVIDVYNADLAFPKQKIAVEIDGGNWHSSKKKVEQDTRKANILASLGWRTIRWTVSSVRPFDKKDFIKSVKMALTASDNVSLQGP